MDRGHGSCAVDSSIPRPIDEHRLDLLIDLAPLGQPGRPQRPTTSRWLERPSGGRRGTRSRRSVPPHPPTWQLLGDELSQPRLELIVGWPSREYSRRDHGLGMSAGRDAKQEIGEALGMQPAPDHWLTTSLRKRRDSWSCRSSVPWPGTRPPPDGRAGPRRTDPTARRLGGTALARCSTMGSPLQRTTTA